MREQSVGAEKEGKRGGVKEKELEIKRAQNKDGDREGAHWKPSTEKDRMTEM